MFACWLCSGTSFACTNHHLMKLDDGPRWQEVSASSTTLLHLFLLATTFVAMFVSVLHQVFLLATPAYWILLWCIHSPHVRGKTLVDIYSACMNGSSASIAGATINYSP
eukprot:2961687-Amphidinium_carterae.3